MKFELNNILTLKDCHATFTGDTRDLSRMASGISIDTRTQREGEIYVAIKGETLDGHDFIGEALAKKAVACVIASSFWQRRMNDFEGQSFFVVDDTLQALQQLAVFARKEHKIPVIGLTGTNGKTTTKEMIASVLSQRGSVCKTQGNFNNHIGVPLTLFGLEKEHNFAVIEMGTNHFGEISDLCTIAQPNLGLITNIGHGHTEHLNDIEGVARAKMELFDYLESNGDIIANMDDPNIAKQQERYHYKTTYGFGKNARLRAENIGLDDTGCPSLRVQGIEIKLNIPGTHNLSNALSAVAVGLEFDLPLSAIKQGLEHIELPSKRMEIIKSENWTILNDSYNANPESTLAALQTLKDMKTTGKKWVVLGDMLELGAHAQTSHAKIGRAVADLGMAGLFAYGPLSLNAVQAAKKPKKIYAAHFADKQALLEDLKNKLSARDAILIKGSRGMKMEEILADLIQENK